MKIQLLRAVPAWVLRAPNKGTIRTLHFIIGSRGPTLSIATDFEFVEDLECFMPSTSNSSRRSRYPQHRQPPDPPAIQKNYDSMLHVPLKVFYSATGVLRQGLGLLGRGWISVK